MAITTLYKAEKTTEKVEPDLNKVIPSSETKANKADDTLTIGGETLNLITPDTVIPQDEEEIIESSKEEIPVKSEVKSEVVEGTTEEPVQEKKESSWPKSAFDRIGEITAQKYEEKKRADDEAAKAKHYESLIAQGKLISADTPPASPGTTPVEDPNIPKLENYPSFESHAAAVAEYTWNKLELKKSKENQFAEGQKEFAKVIDSFKEREAEYMKTDPDYWALVHDDNLPVGVPVAMQIQISPKGPQLMKLLAKNPKVLDALNRMDPATMGRELFKIEQAIKTPEIKTKTTAPKPVKSVSGTGGEVIASKDITKMSATELVDHFRREESTKRSQSRRKSGG